VTLKERITDDMKTAMRAGEKDRLATIRLVLAAVKQIEVDERIVLDEARMLAVLEKMVKQEKISNAIILSGMGSVRGYQVHQVSNRGFPSKNMFVKNPTEPADIVGMSGFISNGVLHPHITLATPDKAFGGHLEPGTNVFTFAFVTLGVLKDGADLSHVDDKSYR